MHLSSLLFHSMFVLNRVLTIFGVAEETTFTNYLFFFFFLLFLSVRGVSYLFDIQVKTFNPVYDGEDVIAQARTGTGKTFSFAIPLVEKLQKESVEMTRGRAPKVRTLEYTNQKKLE